MGSEVPEVVDNPRAATEPTHVILCTWTGAKLSVIRRYQEKYRCIFGDICIKVIETSVKDLCFRSSNSRRLRLQAHVEDIASYQAPRILMHVFSEGGSNTACELAEAYYKSGTTNMPIAALVLDSTPGRPRFFRLCQAASRSLPVTLGPINTIVGSAIVSVTWVLYHGMKTYEHNVISTTRRQLLDSRLWSPSAHRCYLFSDSDALVSMVDVAAHVAASIDRGFPTTFLMFEGSEHVAHERKHSNQYWSQILETWDMSKKQE